MSSDAPAPSVEAAVKSPGFPRPLDWSTPLLLFIFGGGWTMNLGSQAKELRLPAAGFAGTSHVWMVFLIALSFIIPLPKLSRAVWLAGIACMAFAPLLLFSCTKTIPLSRWLTANEHEDFRRQFEIPVVQYSSTNEGPRLRLCHSDDSAAREAFLEKLGVLRLAGGNWEGKWISR